MASITSNDQRDGVYLPKGAGHLLGPQTYEQVLKDNNFFLTTVATIPVNLEYRAWYAVISPTTSSENEPISLHDHLLRQTWFLQIEEVDHRKCYVITTKSNLPQAREWLDTNLESLIRKSIPAGIEPLPSQLPRRLDKPVYSASSKSYADVVKKQFSLSSNAPTTNADNNRPPWKQQAAIIDYDSDQSSDITAQTVGTTSNTQSSMHHHNATNNKTPECTELSAIKKELADLRIMITNAVDQFKSAIATLTTTTQSRQSNDMDTKVETSTACNHTTTTSTDLAAVIQDLKYEIATIITEMRALFQQQLFRATNNKSHSSSVT